MNSKGIFLFVDCTTNLVLMYIVTLPRWWFNLNIAFQPIHLFRRCVKIDESNGFVKISAIYSFVSIKIYFDCTFMNISPEMMLF